MAPTTHGHNERSVQGPNLPKPDPLATLPDRLRTLYEGKSRASLLEFAGFVILFLMALTLLATAVIEQLSFRDVHASGFENFVREFGGWLAIFGVIIGFVVVMTFAIRKRNR